MKASSLNGAAWLLIKERDKAKSKLRRVNEALATTNPFAPDTEAHAGFEALRSLCLYMMDDSPDNK